MSAINPHAVAAAKDAAPSASSPAAVAAVTAVLFGGAIFGFFYAWTCSTMWGLDATDPRVAITAMQAMNDSVRNAVFFPAFFLTPAVMGLAAVLCLRERRRRSAVLLFAAAVVYLLGGLVLTMAVIVPMNGSLAAVVVPEDPAEAERIWTGYSQPWQAWNAVRAALSGVALLAATLAVLHLRHRSSAPGSTAEGDAPAATRPAGKAGPAQA
ncbi:DUF1772 domain-containing protein [Myceligenerans pegani]|uniref:DUF1772 domain-containing protein n=1 Tax=Myceligenerans pegani TaxID=2776917 RepID=A0ABR9MUI1_9MICO|nr:anthrone oxygenase family protein [Myceligenerans sp. TRM 65318]MBE1875027.1 DUF1772 domain-containing protein [Myceligenerans sp. TRM 65318]MBE3017298.1 DUF1772 domain-containing protein [Myceligenerans sp. TRM 65318]